MEIQQHDGMVVDVAGSRQGFAELLREGEVLQGKREAPKAVVLLPSIYIGPPGRGGGAGQEPICMGGRRPGGKLAPQGKWGAPYP